jgi:hypothetical protein
MNPFIAYKTKESIQYINEIPESGLIVTVDRFTLEDYIKFHNIEYNIIDGVYWNEGFNKKFILNPDEKPSFIFTSEGVKKRESNKFKRNASF